MKLPFRSEIKRDLRQPLPSELPNVPGLLIAAQYRAARVGGDFYDFIQLDNSRLLFLVLDIAGRRDEAFHIAAAVQEILRTEGQELFVQPGGNRLEAISELLLYINRVIMEAAQGVRHAPGFLGCYDEEEGFLSYCNAGHLPAFVKDQDGVTLLEAGGLPLGLFSHATHDAQLAVLRPESTLVLVTRGIIEARAGHREFGIAGVRNVLETTRASDAQELCRILLESVNEFTKRPSQFGPQLRVPGFGGSPNGNDITAVVLMRQATAAARAV